MPWKRLTREEFIQRAKAVNGDAYNYDLIEYEGMTKKIHVVGMDGEFDIWPYNFLRRRGPQTKNKPGWKGDRRRPLYGVGINDEFGVTRTPAYRKWAGIIERCYKPNRGKRYPAYVGCSICDEWKYFSCFRRWFEKNSIPGYDLDKDILKQGNRVYCPEYCCFVPREINLLISGLNIKRKDNLPVGVCYSGSKKNPYVVRLKCQKRTIHVGLFKTAEDASAEYKKIKKGEIIRVANEYFKDGKISERVYNALLSFEV
jgi:hypothetical protein